MTRRYKKKTVKLDDVVVNESYQARASLSEDALDDYRRAYQEGGQMPPVDLLQMPDRSLVLYDGFHRYYAAKSAGLTNIEARVLAAETEEPEAEAASLALTANRQHGLRRNRADLARAIELAIHHPWYRNENNARIAELVGCSREYVRQVKKVLDGEEPQSKKTEPEPSVQKSSPMEEAPGEDDTEHDDDPPPMDDAPVDDDAIRALEDAIAIVDTAHSSLGRLRRESGLPQLREAMMHLNTARQCLERELKTR